MKKRGWREKKKIQWPGAKIQEQEKFRDGEKKRRCEPFGVEGVVGTKGTKPSGQTVSGQQWSNSGRADKG